MSRSMASSAPQCRPASSKTTSQSWSSVWLSFLPPAKNERLPSSAKTRRNSGWNMTTSATARKIEYRPMSQRITTRLSASLSTVSEIRNSIMPVSTRAARVPRK